MNGTSKPQNRFQHGSLTLAQNKTAPNTWFYRFYEERGNRRVYRKLRIGSVKELPHRRDAEKAVLHLRSNINCENRLPETVSELVAHYKKHELTEESGKRSSTRQVYQGFLDLHIEPNWGTQRLHEVKSTTVERWLRSLNLAPATKSKIRNIMSAVFAHGLRYGMTFVKSLSTEVRETSCSLQSGAMAGFQSGLT